MTSRCLVPRGGDPLQAMTERRRIHQRAPLHRRVWCESGSITIYAQLANVSEGGLFVKTFAPLSEGARARVRWDLEEQDGEIEAEAVVVWRRQGDAENRNPPGMGLRFEHIDPDDVDRIRRFVGGALADAESAESADS